MSPREYEEQLLAYVDREDLVKELANKEGSFSIRILEEWDELHPKTVKVEKSKTVKVEKSKKDFWRAK